MNLNFDAIVVGSGISGGWAAKELCESGLKTLVLERGRMVKHTIAENPNLEGMPLLRKGQRLSVQTVDEVYFQEVLAMGGHSIEEVHP